jgi:flagellar biosynthesis GTPase FlhF
MDPIESQTRKKGFFFFFFFFFFFHVVNERTAEKSKKVTFVLDHRLPKRYQRIDATKCRHQYVVEWANSQTVRAHKQCAEACRNDRSQLKTKGKTKRNRQIEKDDRSIFAATYCHVHDTPRAVSTTATTRHSQSSLKKSRMNVDEENNGTTAVSSSTAAAASSSTTATNSSNRGGTLIGEKTEALHWVEKYRPNTLDELIGQGEIVHTLQRLIGGDLPHLLFYGPAGVGKTSTIFALAKQIYGKHFKSMILEVRVLE